MRVGIITGSGAYTLPGLANVKTNSVETPHGRVDVNRGDWAGIEVVHIARHGAGHERLSNLVNHRANVFALKSIGVDAVVGLTACGACDPTLELGSLVIFDDLHFPSNRLPDGSLCTYFEAVGDPARAHWVLHGGPYSDELTSALADAAAAGQASFQLGGAYGHVDGPRFNTPVEIAALADFGVAAVSQTGGPETVLCGELELPYALVGFITDYANEVVPGEPTPVAKLLELLRRAPDVFSALLSEALPMIAAADPPPSPAGTVLRLG